MTFSLGFNSNKQKSSSTATTSIDDWLRQRQEGAVASAEAELQPNYSPTSGTQIANYLNPYTQNVVDNVMSQAGRGQRMALNMVGDRASAAKAYGGSRHGVAEGVALGEFNTGLNGLIASLYSDGYDKAADMAKDENRFSFAYPMARRGVLNATLAGVTPTTTTKTSSKGKSSGWSAGWTGGGGGGGGGGEADMIMALMGGG